MRPPEEFDYKIYRGFRWMAVLPAYFLATFIAMVVLPFLVPPALYKIEFVAMSIGIALPICCAIAVAPRHRVFVAICFYLFSILVTRFLGLTGPPPFLEHLIDFLSKTWFCLVASVVAAGFMDRWTKRQEAARSLPT